LGLHNGARLISDLAHAINGVLFGEIDHACVSASSSVSVGSGTLICRQTYSEEQRRMYFAGKWIYFGIFRQVAGNDDEVDVSRLEDQVR
jgi:hypothetical protein